MPRWLKYLLLFFLLLLIGSIPLAMQLDTGSIRGLVTDDLGPLAKVSIEARNAMTGVVSRVESDSSGNYKLDGLRPGRYSLWIKADQHDSTWIREVIVERGQATRQAIQLERIRPTG